MNNKLILYGTNLSSPTRAVKIVAKLLDLELESRNIDLLNGEHLKEPFIKLNPEHTVPTLIDGDFIIWDSHAICSYLVDKYGKNDVAKTALYPKDLQLRARCNQRLFFDAASLFVRLRDCTLHIFKGGKEVPQENIDLIYTAYDILESFLAFDPFLVGNSLTIADISVSVTVILLETYAPLQSDKHSRILAWLKRMNLTISFFDEINTKYANEYRQLILSTLEKNKLQL